MNQEQKSKEQEAAEEKYPIWPNKFKDKDEWLPEEIAKRERTAFIAGLEYAQQREQPWVRVEDELAIDFAEWLDNTDMRQEPEGSGIWFHIGYPPGQTTRQLLDEWKSRLPAPPKD